jgi:hypothetical protein
VSLARRSCQPESGDKAARVDDGRPTARGLQLIEKKEAFLATRYQARRRRVPHLDALSTSAVSAGMSASRAARSARVIDQTDYITTVAWWRNKGVALERVAKPTQSDWRKGGARADKVLVVRTQHPHATHRSG